MAEKLLYVKIDGERKDYKTYTFADVLDRVFPGPDMPYSVDSVLEDLYRLQPHITPLEGIDGLPEGCIPFGLVTGSVPRRFEWDDGRSLETWRIIYKAILEMHDNSDLTRRVDQDPVMSLAVDKLSSGPFDIDVRVQGYTDSFSAAVDGLSECKKSSFKLSDGRVAHTTTDERRLHPIHLDIAPRVGESKGELLADYRIGPHQTGYTPTGVLYTDSCGDIQYLHIPGHLIRKAIQFPEYDHPLAALSAFWRALRINLFSKSGGKLDDYLKNSLYRYNLRLNALWENPCPNEVYRMTEPLTNGIVCLITDAETTRWWMRKSGVDERMRTTIAHRPGEKCQDMMYIDQFTSGVKLNPFELLLTLQALDPRRYLEFDKK